jgi:AcrR family transcriptional regulator
MVGRPREFDRDEALARARDAFWARGYEGTSMADLVSAMGIASARIYAAFGSKEELFREAVALYTETEGVRIWDAVQAMPTAREAVEAVLRATAEAFTTPGKPAGCLVVLGAVHCEPGNEGVCAELREHRARNVVSLRQRLERAVAAGELPADTDCEAVASFYATVQQGLSLQARDGASRESLLAIVRCAMMAWDGLTSAGARGAGRS